MRRAYKAKSHKMRGGEVKRRSLKARQELILQEKGDYYEKENDIAGLGDASCPDRSHTRCECRLGTSPSRDFKLNDSIITALNSLLHGSGVSMRETFEFDQPTLNVDIDLVTGLGTSLAIGHRLNIRSLPDDGLLVQDPNGNFYRLIVEEQGELRLIPTK